MTKLLLVIALDGLCVACGDQESFIVSDGFDEEFRLEEEYKQERFIARLGSSRLEYKVTKSGAVRHHAKDREETSGVRSDFFSRKIRELYFKESLICPHLFFYNRVKRDA